VANQVVWRNRGGERVTAYDPEVANLTPQGDLRLFRGTAHTLTTTQRIFRKPRIVESTKESSMVLIGAARYENQDSGGVNSVLWFLRENEIYREGVPSILTAAVLLRRIAPLVPSEDRSFCAYVQVKAEVVGSSIEHRLLTRSLECKSDNRLIFNPRLPTASLDVLGISRDNLGSVDLTGLAFVKFGPEELGSIPMALEGTGQVLVRGFDKGSDTAELL
jgi:hypothetical protein